MIVHLSETHEGALKAWDTRGRKAYRAETMMRQAPGTTAGDVVRYERDELGNDNHVNPDDIAKLDKIPAERLVWVTSNKKIAQHYGAAEEYRLPPGSIIIGEDGDGGYLVLKGGWDR